MDRNRIIDVTISTGRHSSAGPKYRGRSDVYCLESAMEVFKRRRCNHRRQTLTARTTKHIHDERVLTVGRRALGRTGYRYQRTLLRAGCDWWMAVAAALLFFRVSTQRTIRPYSVSVIRPHVSRPLPPTSVPIVGESLPRIPPKVPIRLYVTTWVNCLTIPNNM